MPKFEHNCEHCKFHGTFFATDGREYDLYTHENDMLDVPITVLAHTGGNEFHGADVELLKLLPDSAGILRDAYIKYKELQNA